LMGKKAISGLVYILLVVITWPVGLATVRHGISNME